MVKCPLSTLGGEGMEGRELEDGAHSSCWLVSLGSSCVPAPPQEEDSGKHGWMEDDVGSKLVVFIVAQSPW